MNPLTDHESITHKALRYSAIAELTLSQLKEFVPGQEQHTKFEQRYDYCQQHHICYAHQGQDQYPYVLHPIVSSPYVMHRVGDISLLYRKSIALVGPRKATPYAQEVMTALFDVLPDYDVVTISGLADGVDMMGHMLSLEKNIPTIAVLGGGLAHFLSSGKRELIQRIVDHGGLVISEFKLDMQPTNWSFPQRNRLVAGLSTAVFVPEAAVDSGSLITVDFAQQMHKAVYGAPQNIFLPSSAGLLRYMQQGLIKPVVDMHQMLAAHFETSNVGRIQDGLFGQSVSQDRSGLSDRQITILQSIMDAGGESSLVALQAALGIDTSSLMAELMMLEVMGKISQSGEKVRVKR